MKWGKVGNFGEGICKVSEIGDGCQNGVEALDNFQIVLAHHMVEKV